MTRLQRYSKVRPLPFLEQPDCAALDYKPNGGTFTVGIFPPLGSAPDVPKIELKTRAGKQSPERCPVDAAFYQIREIDGKVFFCFVLNITGGILPELEQDNDSGLQSLVILADPDGKIIQTVQAAWQRDAQSFSIDFALALMRYEKEVKKGEAKIEIHPINENDYSHPYTVTFSAPGLTWETRGEVKDLKKSGLFGTKKTPYKNVTAWGNALIFQDLEGKYLVAAKGQTKPNKAQNFEYALRAATAINYGADQQK